MATDATHLAWRWKPRWASMETYLATDGLTRYDPSSEQAMAIITFAMSFTKLCGKHVLKFFGSQGGLTAFNLRSATIVSKVQDIDGFGQLAIKEVLSYLGVSGQS